LFAGAAKPGVFQHSALERVKPNSNASVATHSPARCRLALMLAICLSGSAEIFGKETPKPLAPPRLVVQISIDRLRGDLPMRYRERLPKGGFRYLLEEGVH
jgi:hypothetical protein